MIAIADDDRELTHGLSRLLREAGYDVRTASDGGQAYALAGDPKCCALILDLHMPNLNGAELLLLMAHEGNDLPVIAMAGFADFEPDEIKEFPNVRTYLQKPLAPEAVLEAVRRYARPKASADACCL
ncbi:MAG: response regulator [Candidatus Marinimicrobia bacterium]|nr:response regulator [Candidatus Neomarinimicrobiota bacterium]